MLTLNEKHRVVLKTEYVDVNEDKKEYYCYIDGHKRYIQRDMRGKKSKFWIQNKLRTKYAYLLKYEERKNDSMDNVGQFIMTGILEQLGVPHANYIVSIFEKDGLPYDSIISESYKRSPREVEISGYTLNMRNQENEHDNNFGEKADQHHNVNFYMSLLKKYYGKSDVDFEGIREQLLEYALLQYVFVMSDLHYYNLSFSYEEDKGISSLRVNPFYDCGNICNLSLSNRKVKNIYKQLSETRKRNSLVDTYIHRKMPMFGVETDLSVIFREDGKGACVCRPICNRLDNNEDIDKVAQASLQVLRSELANEILFNPKLSQFYERIKKDVKLDRIVSYYNSIKPGTIPYYCADLVQMTMESTIDSLDKAIKKRTKELCAKDTTSEETSEKEVVKC